jgi:protocatechuate 3,4-dioxygenase, alpha subunit
MAHKQTPSQTVGPFFSFGLAPEQYGYPFRAIAAHTMAEANCPSERIRITGRVLDGEGQPVGDALVELWQADAEGRYGHPGDSRRSNSGFKGFGRAGTGTDPELRFTFDTIMPGRVEPNQAPHISIIVFARGMLNHLYTRLYFEDRAVDNARDAVLQGVTPERRATLIAKLDTSLPGRTYRFDIRLQGESETVFFDL